MITLLNRREVFMSYDLQARTGTFGQNPELMREYIIYVHKKDYDYASTLLQGNMK